MKLLNLVPALLAVGCTHWATSSSFGPRQEVGRRLVGSPQIEEVSSTGMAAGFSGGSSSDGMGNTGIGGAIAGHSATIKRTHCVQQAEVDYVQPVQTTAHQEHRALDVAGSIILGIVGLATVSAASNDYNNQESFYEMDPSFFSKPSTPTGAYIVGGGMMVGAAAWLIYSFSSLPKGPAPAPEEGQRHWTETAYVEATGCGLVPADRTAQAPGPAPLPAN